jgi:hypothetical protein
MKIQKIIIIGLPNKGGTYNFSICSFFITAIEVENTKRKNAALIATFIDVPVE